MFGRLSLAAALVSVLSATLLGLVTTAAVDANRACDLGSFAGATFPNPTVINNQWLPLAPGTQFTYQGTANRGGGTLPHTVVFTVTDLTKVVNGIRTITLYDVDLNDGQLAEAELAFFAQDAGRNVWTIGEMTAEFTNGTLSGAPSVWIAGIAGAQAGVLVPQIASVGNPDFLQGFAPAVDFFDCGRVLKTGENVCVPVGCFTNVTVVDEWSPLQKAGGHQLKYYAPNFGLIQIAAVADREGETLSLIQVRRLSAPEMNSVRQAAMNLDALGRQVSDVYRLTAPLIRS